MRDEWIRPDLREVDPKAVEEVEAELDQISASPLWCDTLILRQQDSLETIAELSTVYFDANGRPRIIKRNFDRSDGSHESIWSESYYDTRGLLVYSGYDLANNRGGESYRVYFREGNVVDYACWFEGEYTERWQADSLARVANSRRGIGDLFTDTEYWSGMFCDVHADSLLNNISTVIYDQVPPSPPGTFPRRAAEITYYDSLEAIGGTVIATLTEPEGYLIEKNEDESVEYDRMALFAFPSGSRFGAYPLLPDGPYLDFKFTRMDIDGCGADELLIRWKKARLLRFYKFNQIGCNHSLYYTGGLAIWNLYRHESILYVNTYDWSRHWTSNDGGMYWIKDEEISSEEDVPEQYFSKIDIEPLRGGLRVNQWSDFYNTEFDIQADSPPDSLSVGRGATYFYKVGPSGFSFDHAEKRVQPQH